MTHSELYEIVKDHRDVWGKHFKWDETRELFMEQWPQTINPIRGDRGGEIMNRWSCGPACAGGRTPCSVPFFQETTHVHTPHALAPARPAHPTHRLPVQHHQRAPEPPRQPFPPLPPHPPHHQHHHFPGGPPGRAAPHPLPCQHPHIAPRLRRPDVPRRDPPGEHPLPPTDRHLCFDLQPGDIFTVRSHIQSSPPTGSYGDQSFFIPNTRPSGLFPGLPLRFRALDHPFILCTVVNQAGLDTVQTILDVRTHSIQRLSPTFISAMTSFTPPQSSPPIPEFPGCPDDTSPPAL